MLRIINLYKHKGNKLLNDIDINIEKGTSVSIECSNEISDLLVNIIIGKEVQGKGEVYIEEEKISKDIKTNYKNIGFIPREDFFYEFMTIERYMKFFQEIMESKKDYRDIMEKLAILDIGSKKIKELSYSEKRRLSFAREMLKNPKILIFQEPILNVNKDEMKIIIENIERLKHNGVSVLITSIFLKDTLLLGEKSYKLDENGLVRLENNEEIEVKEEFNKSPVYEIEKIQAKIEDRILLFDPIEIDYIESENGVSCLNVRGEKFPSSSSLTELEGRLQSFGFFRCHRSYIVNLQRVREVVIWTRNSYSLNLDDKNKSAIPLSKGRLESLKDILKL